MTISLLIPNPNLKKKEVPKMITRYRPFDNRLRTFDRLSRMMDEFFGDETEVRSGWMPSVDVKETDQALTFYVEVPGMRQEDIDVELVGDVLTIRGKREFSDEEKRDDYVRIERSYGSFQRSFTIGVPVKADEISATYRDGILTVVVPKADEVKPRKIEVKTN
ncbi:MAG: molecular chaperone [Fimbriimonadales bacterium]|nr:MAG: molecular chaperone [Fimbriimonadales bacterium]